MEKGVSVVSPWTPVTPATPVLSRAGKVAATELPLIDLNVGLDSSEEYPPGFEPNVLLDDESGDFPPGFEPKILFEESEEFPPGFEPMVLSAETDSSCGVFCSVLEPTRREDCNLEAGDTSKGEGYGFIPTQSVSSFAGFKMAPSDPADVLYYASTSSHHDVPMSSNSCQSYSFPGKFSASNICKGLDADTLDTSLSLAPITPGKAGGLPCRNSEAETSTVKNQIVDKGDTQGIELKTPLKKEKRKKHRPKVVKEAKPGLVASKKQTASESSVPGEYATPKRKYVTRKGTESACTGQCDSAKLETTQSHYDDHSTRKRMYVRDKGDEGAESTHLTEVPNNSTIPAISGNSSRKLCRRALSFEAEVSVKEDEATEITDDGLDLISACSLFPKQKWTRTGLPPLTVLNRAKSSPDHKEDKAAWARSNMSMTEMVLCVQHKFDYFQNVVSMGAATAMAPATLYGNIYSTGSHYNSNQAHPYWALSLPNLHEDIAVYDGRYSTQENSFRFPRAVGLTGRHSCSVQVEGAMPSITAAWNSSCCVEELADKPRMPCVNQMISGVPRVASDDPTYQQHDMIVAYKPAGMIVPYVNTPMPKKSRQRAQVEIDDETNRVWQLLLENADNDGINGTDEEKARWWKEERALFQGRADSFITKMRLVQGDRRFSLWKGSVIDSIVGVFLTQNVSDNLSSSAFMSFASSYPIKGSQKSRREEAVASAMSHPNSSIPHENNAETQSRMDNSFTRLLNLANDGIQNGLFMRENDRGIHSYERSPLLNEESKQIDKKDPTGKPNSEEEEKGKFDWDSLRKEAEARRSNAEAIPNNLDSVDWESVRHEPEKVISSVIEKRGMHNKLAERIKEFLNRVVRDHGRLDLEWLRDIPPDKAKEYLLSFTGLGPKSVDCVRLLTLHHVAFPVDINVGRVAVRLGWVPLQPLPDSLQLHLLEMYPVLESVQRYLWPRLCKLDQGTLYELHYQMITFGKVFCTKTKPNCKACPMRAECRHFASSFANERLGLPVPEQTGRDVAPKENMPALLEPLPFSSPTKNMEILDIEDLAGRYKQRISEPIIEEPASPEPECVSLLGNDLEDSIVDFEDDEEIPTIELSMEEIDRTLQMFSPRDMYLHEDEMSKALVVLPPQAASVPVTPLKSRTRLRTEHIAYEIPQGHPLLDGLDKLELDDPSQYLLAIWTPGETATSIQPPEGGCSGYTSGDGQLCEESSCIRCCSIREANLQIVRGTLLIPCRTAMRGSFPLNGTYFQVNEVFEDHETSVTPLNVPRGLIWNLPRRILYCGSTISSILRDMSMEAIRHCFWRGYVCVRGFDRTTRKACPLTDRMHVLASKGDKAKAEAKARAKPKTNSKTK